MTKTIELSILVISHNQEKVIARCLDSVFAQKIDVPYEVILSDDASTDKTLTIASKYLDKYPSVFRVIHIDTTKLDATIGSDHASLNKINAYRASNGKYFVFIDGDDYLTCDTVYQEQLDLLKQHPECAMCRQEIMRCDNDHPEKGLWKWGENFETGRIITAQEYFENGYFISNPAFMLRKYDGFPPDDKLFCKLCNDEFITFWHLQRGDIVCLNRADYMYVSYSTSIDNSYDAENNKLAKYSTSVLMYMHYFPTFSMLIYRTFENRLIHFLKVITWRDLVLSDTMLSYLNQFDGFIFQYLTKQKHTLFDKIKVNYIRLVVLLSKRYGFTNNATIYYVFRILTSKEWNGRLIEEQKIKYRQ